MYASIYCRGIFLSTLSAWRATVCAKRLCAFFQISIHALRMESDDYSNFISYRPRGISIHALRMESDIIIFICQDGRYDISIHALRMESDFPTCTPPFLAKHFYPRSPHGERLDTNTLILKDGNFYPRSPHGERHGLTVFIPRWVLFLSTLSAWRATSSPPIPVIIIKFLSTLSAWRATLCSKASYCFFLHFYPRSPHGERQDLVNNHDITVAISIHALRMESDIIIFICQDGRYDISIHALRMESDFPTCTPPFLAKHFYPRSPHGERRRVFCTAKNLSLISIHALRMESDHAL